MLIKKYSFRYIDKSRTVYAIVKNTNARNFSQVQLFTVPFPSVNSLAHDSNCILTFVDKHYTESVCDDMKQIGVECMCHEFNLNNLTDFASSIQLPTLVVLNSYCSLPYVDGEDNMTYEVYYSFNPTEQSRLLLKKQKL